MGNRISHCEEPPAQPEVESAPAEEVASEPASEPAAEVKVGTAPIDFRFPSVNQSRTCYTHYNEYHKCIAEKGEGSKECLYHYRFFHTICPNEWIEKWDELRTEGNWYGKY